MGIDQALADKMKELADNEFRIIEQGLSAARQQGFGELIATEHRQDGARVFVFANLVRYVVWTEHSKLDDDSYEVKTIGDWEYPRQLTFTV